MRTPVALASRHVLEKTWEGSLALRLIKGFIWSIAWVIPSPAGGRSCGLLEPSFGAGETGGALKCGGCLAGTMAGRDELGEDGVDIVAVGVHAIPDGQDQTT